MGEKVFVLTRSADKNEELALKLQAQGGQSISIATHLIEPYSDIDQSRQEYLETAEWLCFFSDNGARYFQEQSITLPSEVKIAAIGKSTAQALTSPVDFIATKATSYDFALELIEMKKPESVLLVRGTKTTGQFAALMEENNIPYQELLVYENKKIDLSEQDLEQIREIAPNKRTFLFYSPSAFEPFLEHLEIFQGAEVLALGPTTRSYIEEAGVLVDAEKSEQVFKSLE